MNWLLFLEPLIQQLVTTIGPIVLDDINKLLGTIATQHGVTLTPTPAHNPPSQ